MTAKEQEQLHLLMDRLVKRGLDIKHADTATAHAMCAAMGHVAPDPKILGGMMTEVYNWDHCDKSLVAAIYALYRSLMEEFTFMMDDIVETMSSLFEADVAAELAARIRKPDKDDDARLN